MRNYDEKVLVRCVSSMIGTDIKLTFVYNHYLIDANTSITQRSLILTALLKIRDFKVCTDKKKRCVYKCSLFSKSIQTGSLCALCSKEADLSYHSHLRPHARHFQYSLCMHGLIFFSMKA